MSNRQSQVCTNCVMDTTDSLIQFDENGVCDHCNNYYNALLPEWKKNENNVAALQSVADEIKASGRGKKYDCIIGFSGGVDSSYLCYIAKEVMGLNPLAYCVDTGWNLKVADHNIQRMVDALGIDLYTEVVDWDEMKDLQLAFLKSQVAYQDLPQDHAIFAGLYNYAVKNKIKYVLTGANVATESIRAPIEWVYMNDLRFMKDVHKNFGTRPLKTFPSCGMFKYRLYYAYILGMKRVAPLDFIEYEKDKVEAELHEKFGWERYENKHFEDLFTRWYEGYYLPKKFGYDKRKCYFSNLILTGSITRDEALQKLQEPSYPEETAIEDMKYIAEKLGITYEELQAIISKPNKTFRDYKNSYGRITAAIKLAQILGVEKRAFR